MMESRPLLSDSEEGRDMDSIHADQSLPLQDPAYTEPSGLPAAVQQFRSRVEAIRTKKFIRVPSRFCYAFVPQLIRTLFFNDPIPPAKLHHTSWLDGFRGLAALAVFNLHFFVYFADVRPPGGQNVHPWLFQLPILRLFYSGTLAVLVFFLVAGYAISYRSLQLMSRPTDPTSQKSLYSGLSASVFRRFFRLYLPCLAITFMTAMAVYLGSYEFVRKFSGKDSKKFFPGPAKMTQGPRFPSLLGQLTFWLQQLWTMMSVWDLELFYPALDSHLWTIRIEFRASLALYVALVALSPARILVRFFSLFLLSVYCMSQGRWEEQLFFGGACLAQFDVWKQLRQEKRQQQQQKRQSKEGGGGAEENRAFISDFSSAEPDVEKLSSPAPATLASRRILPLYSRGTRWVCLNPGRLIYNIFWVVISLVSLFLMSRGLRLLAPIIPEEFVTQTKTEVQSIGSAMLIICLILADDTSLSHKFLNSRPVQYLGKIVFSLYLVHGPLMRSGLYMMPHFVWAAMGFGFPAKLKNMGVFPHVVGIVVGWVLVLVLVLWAADVFFREVEERMRRVMYWIQGISFTKKS
jgi:peptidoglycan/LPS O-acetylase OafA/YrhL